MPETNFFWDPLSDNILQERDEFGAVTAEYTAEPGLYGNIISQNRGGVESQFHYDAQGSTFAVTDDDQNVTDTFAYAAFGEVTERTGTTQVPFQYIGQRGYYTDGLTGHIMARRRPYEPVRARWLCADPIALTGPTVQPHISPYQYSFNDPLSFVDPSGLFCEVEPCCCCVDSMDIDPRKTAKQMTHPLFGPGIGLSFTVDIKTKWDFKLKDPTKLLAEDNDCLLVWNERSTMGISLTPEQKQLYKKLVKEKFGVDIDIRDIKGQQSKEWYNQLVEFEYLLMWKPWRDRKKPCPTKPTEDISITDTPGLWNIAPRDRRAKANTIQFEIILKAGPNCDCPEGKQSKVLYREVRSEITRGGMRQANIKILNEKPSKIPHE